mmetsp:Transcript_67705/g.144878  ORF Transcript_67705/g.144878 Transcript_67705/m.144878 type:complete len:319 (-) Transcript_67705:51-1007(-)
MALLVPLARLVLLALVVHAHLMVQSSQVAPAALARLERLFQVAPVALADLAVPLALAHLCPPFHMAPMDPLALAALEVRVRPCPSCQLDPFALLALVVLVVLVALDLLWRPCQVARRVQPDHQRRTAPPAQSALEVQVDRLDPLALGGRGPFRQCLLDLAALVDLVPLASQWGLAVLGDLQDLGGLQDLSCPCCQVCPAFPAILVALADLVLLQVLAHLSRHMAPVDLSRTVQLAPVAQRGLGGLPGLQAQVVQVDLAAPEPPRRWVQAHLVAPMAQAHPDHLSSPSQPDLPDQLDQVALAALVVQDHPHLLCNLEDL